MTKHALVMHVRPSRFCVVRNAVSSCAWARGARPHRDTEPFSSPLRGLEARLDCTLRAVAPRVLRAPTDTSVSGLEGSLRPMGYFTDDTKERVE